MFCAWLGRFDIRRIIVYCGLLLLVSLTAYVRTKAPGESKEDAGKINLDLPSSSPPPPPAVTQVVPVPAEPLPLPNIAVTGIEQDTLSLEDRQKTRLAANKMKAGDFAGAVDIFKEVAQRDGRALAAVGICYFNLTDYAQALSYLRKAIEYDGSDFTSLKLLAFAYYRTDNLAKSLQSAEAALALKRDDDLEALQDRLKKEMRVQEGYSEESSSHFTIFYDGYSHGKIDRQVIGMLEDAYRTVGRELNYFPADAVSVILYTDRDFFDVTQTPSWTAGYYDGKIRIPVKGAEERSVSLKKVLFHEYTHAVVRSITKRCPLWINEGLAEYFSTDSPRKVGQMIPLRSLETSFSGLSVANVRTAYLESYSAVSCLIEKYGIYRVKGMLLALAQGEDVNRAFADAFGITYDTFLSEWH
jgi:tetratricopeptide (TPR) repeat protein